MVNVTGIAIRCKGKIRLYLEESMNASSVHTRRLSDLTALFLTVCMYANAEGADGKISQSWVDLYEPHIYNEMPYRLMTPLHFDSNKRFPVIVSCMAEAAEGQITGNNCAAGTGFLLKSRDVPITHAMCLLRKPTAYGMEHTSRTSKMSLQHCRPLT